MTAPSIRDLACRVRSAVEAGRMPATEAEYDAADAEYLAAKLDLLTKLSAATGLTIPEVRALGDVL